MVKLSQGFFPGETTELPQWLGPGKPRNHNILVDSAPWLSVKSPPVKCAFRIAALLLFCALTFAARCHNLRDVFLDGQIYFLDGDCYARMSRARLVAEHPGVVIRHHDFENFPAGVNPHTTAPLDYLIVGLKSVFDLGFSAADSTSALRSQTLDLAGALIGPLLAVAGTIFLAVWCWALRLRFWEMALLLYAVSPILVHGAALGRPDHQALLIVLLTMALGAEIALMRLRAAGISRPEILARWGTLAGAARGLSLWVSLYEPLVLLASVAVLWLVRDWRALGARERRTGWVVCASIVAVAFLLEGWRLEIPDAAMRAFFSRWKMSIGELAPLPLLSSTLFGWLGWTALAAPVLLVRARKDEPAAGPVLFLLLLTLALSVWQIRWGYFFASVFVLALPIFLPAFRPRWLAWPAFLIALFPLAQEWDARLFPNPAAARDLAMKRTEAVMLRRTISAKGRGESGAFLAPWWLSPSIAYWTRQPGVAGSSHESLPGIVDAARIWLAPDMEAALPLLRAREVAWILADTPERVVPSSAALLAVASPEKCLAHDLAQPLSPASLPALVREKDATLSRQPSFFQVWRMQPSTGDATLPAP